MDDEALDPEIKRKKERKIQPWANTSQVSHELNLDLLPHHHPLLEFD
jgi:hypothetical protein